MIAVSLDMFKDGVQRYFQFLVTEYGYKLLGIKEVKTVFQYDFIKADNIVRLEYSKKNHYLTIIFFKEVYKNTPTTQDGKNSLMLSQIISQNNKRHYYVFEDYDAFMPSKIGFENSLDKLAELLKRYGHNFLKGQSWKGWGS